MNNYQRISRELLLVGMAFGLLSSTAYAQQANIMQGRIWDFSSSHPDFETGRGGPVTTGQVAPMLGPDGKPVWAGSPNDVFSSPEAFDQWYRDVPGVNLSKPFSIELVESSSGSGEYTFDRYNFFPIDNEMLGNEGDRFLDRQGLPHNFHYTMQLAGEFSYQNDSDTFTFIGDDDLWVFFGGRLGIDLGGVHAPANATITGAQLRELGLDPNQSYPIDIFFAERQTDGSNFVIQTNFNIQPPAAERVPVGEHSSDEAEVAHLTLPLPPGTELVRGERYWSPSGEHFLTLNPDGNLVVARADGGYVWGFDTQPDVDFRRVGRVVWQEDGNLAAYAEDGAYLWSALTVEADPGAQLVLRPSGALQIAVGDRVLWTSTEDVPVAVAEPSRIGLDSVPAIVEQTNTGDMELPWEPQAAGGGTPVAFVSTDGTALFGSRSVFIVRNDATGQSTLVPVVGMMENSGTVVHLPAGTYTVTPPPPSIGEMASFTTDNVSTLQIDVPDQPNAAEPAVTVSFSLLSQTVPVSLVVTKLSANHAELKWEPQPGVEVAEYVLVRTDGPAPAANPDAGQRIPLEGPGATTAVADGLLPSSTYTFTLFSTAPTGEAFPVRTFTAVTANPGSTDAAFAVAPNTIRPVDFELLEATRVGEDWVRVKLDPAGISRGSNSAMPGVDASVIEGAACVVGTPFLVSSDVAGDEAFYGQIEACESSVQGVSQAIVNTDVPMNTVFSYYLLDSVIEESCYAAATGEPLAPDAYECSGSVTVTPQDPSAQAAGGDVQVTLLWSSGDDLDLRVNEPNGTGISWKYPASASGGLLDTDDRGADCRIPGDRVENVSWSEAALPGTYTVEIWNHKACSAEVDARLQVRVGGEIVIDQVVRVGVDGPVTFSIGSENAALSSVLPFADDRSASNFNALRMRALAGGLPVVPTLDSAHMGILPRSPYASSLPPVLVAQAGGNSLTDLLGDACEGKANASVDIGAYLKPAYSGKIEIADSALIWDIAASITAGVNPTISFGGSLTCATNFKGVTFQVSTYPIPINLEVKPVVTAAATGALSLHGPDISLTLGFTSDGWASVYTLGPVPIKIVSKHNTKPVAKFNVGSASLNLKSSLSFGAGAEANLGVGFKNSLITAKAGVSLGLTLLAAELSAINGSQNACAQASVGAKIGVDLLGEMFLLDYEKLGLSLRQELFESELFEYPGANFKVGNCPK